MNAKLREKMEAVISACADKAAKADTAALEALQYTEAAVNASNAIIALECDARQKGNG